MAYTWGPYILALDENLNPEYLNNVAHDAIRIVERCLSEFEKEILLTAYSPKIPQQFAIDFPFRARPDMVNGRDQEIDQFVGEIAAT